MSALCYAASCIRYHILIVTRFFIVTRHSDQLLLVTQYSDQLLLVTSFSDFF